MLVLDRPEEVNAFLETLDVAECPGSFQAIGDFRDGKCIAGVLLHRVNSRNGWANIGILPGYFPRGLLVAFFAYTFGQLALSRLTFLVGSVNLRSIRFCRHLGATLEATLQGADDSGDLLIFSLLPDNCYLWSRYGKKIEAAESTRSE